MKTVTLNLCAMPPSPAAVLLILKMMREQGHEPKRVEASIAQLVSWEMQGKVVSSALQAEMPKEIVAEIRDAGCLSLKTLGGLPLKENNDIPITEVWFYGDGPDWIGKLECLAIPNGLECPAS